MFAMNEKIYNVYLLPLYVCVIARLPDEERRMVVVGQFVSCNQVKGPY